MLDQETSTAITPTSLPADRSAAAHGRARRAIGWWIAGVVALVLLGLLGYAEVKWLHELPQDHATRITLIVLPAAAEPATGDWSDRLLESAKDETLLANVIANLDLRDASSGQPRSPAALEESMRLGSQCIVQGSGTDAERRGLLVYAAVRGTGAADTESVAQEWSRLFIERGSAAFPGLTIQPATTAGVSYDICH